MFTVLRPFLRLPPEPQHILTWFDDRSKAMAAKGPSQHITHGLAVHPLTQQHGVGSPEAVDAWTHWAEKVGRLYSPSELFAMLQRPQRESDEDYSNRICEKIPEGAWYTAEDLGSSYGDDLDAIGEQHGVKRFVYKP